MVEYFDLFAELGIKPEEPKEVKKKSAGKTAKKKAVKDEKTTLPVTVYTGYSEPFTVGAEKKEVTLKQVQELIETHRADYPMGISVLQKGKGNVLYLVHKSSYMVEKASLHFNKDTKVMLAGNELDFSTVKTAEECDLSTQELETHFSKMFPEYGKVGFIHAAISNLIVPTFNFPQLTEEVDFPVRVGIFGRQDVVINKEDYLNIALKNTSDTDKKNEDAEDNEGESNSPKVKEDIKKAEIEVIEAIIIEKYPDFAEDHLELQWNDKDKMVIAKMVEKSFKPAAPKKEEFPTDATLSLLYTSIKLSSEMFGGKAKVEKEELRKYIEKDRPEYSEERTSIGYDKENNLIIMTVSGSRKGIELVYDDYDAMEKVASDYCLYDWYKDGGLYRVEGNSSYCIVAPKPNKIKGAFTLLLPKIPNAMHQIAERFFSAVYDRFKTEAMLQLFFDKEEQCYFWNVPLQTVSTSFCDVIRDETMEMKYTLVADFHSHGGYSSYFSRQDDEDEKGFRIFGVYGGFGCEDRESVLKLRAGTGGCFVDLDFDDIFEEYTEDVCWDVVARGVQTLLNYVDLKIMPKY